MQRPLCYIQYKINVLTETDGIDTSKQIGNQFVLGSRNNVAHIRELHVIYRNLSEAHAVRDRRS